MLDEGLRLGRLRKRVFRIVVGAHPPFLFDHRELGSEALGIEILHPVGLEADRHVEMVAVDHLKVVGEVGAGERVIHPAVLLDDVGELLGPVLFGAAEFQMFDQVRDAGLAEALVARANLGKHVEGRHRRLVILQHEDLEPVGQGFGLDGVGDARARRARRPKSSRKTSRQAPGSTPEGEMDCGLK
jgi:hypothetical protein